jgi:hypothetical protein
MSDSGSWRLKIKLNVFVYISYTYLLSQFDLGTWSYSCQFGLRSSYDL